VGAAWTSTYLGRISASKAKKGEKGRGALKKVGRGPGDEKVCEESNIENLISTFFEKKEAASLLKTGISREKSLM